MQTNILNIVLTFSLLLTGVISLFGQSSEKLVYYDAREFTLIGKAAPTSEFYHRVDTAKYNAMPVVVKRLFTNSAGLAIMFKTNSNVISAKWSTSSSQSLDNMTAIAQKGLDLYIKRNGKWIFTGVGRPRANSTIAELITNMADGEKECLLYLPLYDELKSLEIGISEGGYINPLPNLFSKRVIIYGSSIVQGASASRPGMAYPARMSRSLGIDFINLGLSGNGKMEKTVADMVKDMKADAYILDCVANPSPEEIIDRTKDFVMTIRKHHPKAPIIMITGGWRESANFNQKIEERVLRKNENFKQEYEKLIGLGVENLYYIEGDMLGEDHEGSTDTIHPNDLGFDRMLKVIQPAVARILGQY